MGHYDYSLSEDEIRRNREHREYLEQRRRDKIDNHPGYTPEEKQTLHLILRATQDGLFEIKHY